MWFNILTENHGSSLRVDPLAPMIDYVRETLSRCGHEVTVVHGMLCKDAINLYFEYFQDDGMVDRLLAASREMRVGIVATELVVNGHIPYQRHGMYIGQGDLQQSVDARLRSMKRLAPHLAFIWCFLERTVREYAGACPLVEHFPVGHVRATAAELRRAPKDIDVVFFGQATPHRVRVIEALHRAGIQPIVVGQHFPSGPISQVHLKSLLDRAKIGLNLTLHALDETEDGTDPRFVSCLRVRDMIEREICVVSERIPLDNPYDRFMVSAEPDGIAGICHDLLASGRWAVQGRKAAENFRRNMDVTTVCKPVIDRTLAALEPSGPGR